jgi:xanthine dehydrogenase accessory factor
MKRELIDLAASLARRGEPFALATVVARSPPISAQVGDAAVVTGDGGFHGWVGGSCTRPTVIAEARKALADGRPRLVALDPDPASRQRPGLTVFPMTCQSGGSVEIHIQPVLPPARLLVYGVSPTARALVRLGRAMGYAVAVIDATAEAADFPEADAVLTDAAAVAQLAPGATRYAVVATQGQWDEEATAAALALDPPPAYLGVMASGKRFGEMRALLVDGVGEAALARIKNPAGLDLGATLPEEIAVSILAEIVAQRAASARATSHAAAPGAAASGVATPASASAMVSAPRRRSLAQVAAPVAATSGAAPATDGQAIDPVCGMSVTIAGAAHRAEHDGRAYYFCCGGCRARFVATPASYLGRAVAR